MQLVRNVPRSRVLFNDYVLMFLAAALSGCAARSVSTARVSSSEASTSVEEAGPPSTPSPIPVPIPLPIDSSRLFEVSAPHAFSLANGIVVWHVRFSETPLVSLRFVFDGGARVDPAGKEGLAHITGDLLDEGTGELDALQFADQIDYLGASLSVGSGRSTTVLSLQVLESNLAPALDLAAGCLRRPRLAADDLVRTKELWINGLKQRRDSAAAVARLVGDRAFFGEQHPYAHPVRGYESSAASIEIGDVTGYYRQCVRPERLTILVAAGITESELRALLESRFGDWQVERPAGAATAEAPTPGGGARLIVVDKPDAPQTVVRMLLPAPAPVDPESAPLIVANGVFGGVFTSRLSTNLRERNGFTYGAGSRYATERGFGFVLVASDVFTAKTRPALVEFGREFFKLQSEEITNDELAKARASYRTGVIEALETESGALSLFQRSLELGEGPNHPRERFEAVAAATPAATLTSARRYLRWDQATIVLVGDRGEIDSALQSLRAEPPADLPGVFTLPDPEYRNRDGQRID